MQASKIDITQLQSVKNYADSRSVTTAYIYKLIKEKKLISVDIDGVKFINKVSYPAIPSSR